MCVFFVTSCYLIKEPGGLCFGGCWMIISMDLNASPLPEEDEQPLEEHAADGVIEEGHYESSVELLRRVNAFLNLLTLGLFLNHNLKLLL